MAFIGIEKHGEGEIALGANNLALDVFERLPNGKKIEEFQKENYVWGIVSCLNSQRRNGIGHNSARYDVLTDTIFVRNQSSSGKIHDFNLSYNDFCFDLLQLYIAIENLSVFVHWLYKKSCGYI